jgi:drug/metabolite transporter (DMT)-like permease
MNSSLFKTPLPYIALLIAHVIWGINFVVAKVTLNEIPVMSLGFLRFFLAALLMIPFLFTIEKSKRSLKFKHLLQIFLIGIFLTTFNIAFFYEGIKRTEAIAGSVLMLVTPVISLLGAWIFLREKIYLINFLGILVCLFGTSLVLKLPLIFFGNFGGLENLLGNGLLIASAICFVIGSIMSKRLLAVYSPIFLTITMFIVGAITFAGPAAFEYYKDPSWVTKVDILGILGALFIVLLSTVSAFFLLIWGYSKLPVTQANLIQYIEPAVTATFAVAFLNERISYLFIVGTCLVVLGVYWGTLGKQEHHHLPHRAHRT